MILSASRRTDIPAFYSEWFMKRIREGYVLVRNPMNYHSISKVILDPSVLDCIVFWSKNPAPLLPYLTELSEKYQYYFQYTLNAYDSDIEPNLPPLEERINTFITLSKTVGKERVIWRYDPIVLTEKYSLKWHLNTFEYLASRLSTHTNSCVFSFLDIYDKIVGNMNHLRIIPINATMMKELSSAMQIIANQSQIILKTCSEDIDLSDLGIAHSCCIDPVLISKMLGCRLHVKKDPNQRGSCGCIESIDIGQYNTCRHGCKYCYANYSYQSVCTNAKKHNPDSPILLGQLEDTDKVTERRVQSIKDIQISMF